MKCDVCSFDMGHDLGESGRCAGCGTPLGPASDHDRPAPGIDVNPDYDDPFTVTEEMRMRNPKMEDRFLILECDIKWGRGIGAETYGYYLKRLEEVVRVGGFAETDKCPECGDNRAVHEHGFDGCVAGYDRLTCNTCDHEYHDEFWC